LVLTAGIQAIQAQVKLTQIHLTNGSYNNFGDSPAQIGDFSALASGSSILLNDFSQYHQNGMLFDYMWPYRISRRTGTSSFQSLQVGLKLPRCNGTLRLGISNYKNNLMNAYASYSESHVVDTLISSQNGSMTFIDSTVSRNVFGNYSNQQIRFEAAYVWETNAGERWAFSAGAGMSFGVSYQSRTSLHYQEYTNSYQGFGTYQGTQTSTYESEHYNNSLSFGANLYVPLGINFRLGTKSAFWKPWMIYTELRPQLSFNSIPNVGMKFSPGIGAASGIRFNIQTANRKGHADF